MEYRFYELTGDLPEALHFRHFEQTIKLAGADPLKVGSRVRLKDEIRIMDPASGSVRDRIRIKDHAVKEVVSVRPASSEPVRLRKKSLVKLADAQPNMVQAKGEGQPSKKIVFANADDAPKPAKE